MIVFLLATAVGNTAQATPPPASEPLQASWGTYTGFPWTGVHYSPPANQAAQWVIQAETALFRRWDASAGVRWLWPVRENLSMQTTLSAGWIAQTGPLSRHGPQANVALRLQYTGRFVPRLEHKSTAFWAESSTDPDYQGLSETIGVLTPLRSHSWEIGWGIPMRDTLLVEPSIRFGSVDEQFAIPAISLGIRTFSNSRQHH